MLLPALHILETKDELEARFASESDGGEFLSCGGHESLEAVNQDVDVMA